jgi:ribosomal protein S18 acetylase RimI-like enzyme
MKKENIVVREITNEDRIQIADLYCRVFAGAPWFEDFWTREKALKVLDSAINNNGFRGVIAVLNSKVMGFSFGYELPDYNTDSVAFSKVKNMFKSKNIPSDKLFYGAETGIDPDYQNKGFGTIMFDERMKLVKSEGYFGVCSRTINPAMIRVYEKVFGEENVKAVFKDPVNKERTWYYVHLRK